MGPIGGAHGAPWAPQKKNKKNDKHLSPGWAQRSEKLIFCVFYVKLPYNNRNRD